jgi:antitoxin component of RelBE/YafQ-DinJ toxin-antitoxin module
MTKETTVSVRVTQQLAEAFEQTLKTLNMTKSEYLKACIERLSTGTKYEKELALSALGFSKKEQWTK